METLEYFKHMLFGYSIIVKTDHKNRKIQVLEIINKATVRPELVTIRSKMSHNIALLFDSEWLCHYPRRAKVVYNNATDLDVKNFKNYWKFLKEKQY